MKGKVKWYDSRKGYGYILGEDGKEQFVHHSDLAEARTLKYLAEGDEVEYNMRDGMKGPQCADVKVTKFVKIIHRARKPDGDKEEKK